MKFTDQFIAATHAARECRVTTLSHIVTLIHLSERINGAFMTNLAAVAKVTTAAMTGTVDTLEKMNLVERRAFDPDRRAVRVHITEEGRQALKKMFP